MDTSEIKTIKVKLLKAVTEEQEVNGLNSWDEIREAIKNVLESDASNEIYYTNLDVYLNEDGTRLDIIQNIKGRFKATVRDGVMHGCYGSSTGEIFEGYTLYLPLELAQEYFNAEYAEYAVNPIHEIESMGGEFLDYTEKEIETYLDIAEESGIKIHHDNTYNHETDGCYLMCDMDIKLIGDLDNDEDHAGMLAVRFHCGGDIRGNYTRWYLVKFDSQYDVYSAILPTRDFEQE
jgi:hypothetical protein